ncbi:tRNA pseudouridine synthase [Stachybotrys elegans]|uniref:tRNA pseudouridine synthase 1 n=1 Tax=Stachybotrys elegans TaxID=80388 RepID=A0A8K0WYF4_9HYPO|nr:tRNA pseudouridine synthase [Stachybotrys elegans]
MAAENEPSANTSDSMAGTDANNTATSQLAEGQSNGQGAGSKKRKGDKGRKEWNRSKPVKGKSDEYRELKRRRTDKNGNAIEGGHAYQNPFSKEEIAAEERRPKRKVAVLIGYAGTGYKGMQLNGNEPTIERDLFQAFVSAGAISKANADDPRKSSLARCARTDKGVHAAGNVISLKLIIEDEDIVQKINERLPPQIRVWGILRTSNSYSSYQFCDSRWYEYLLPTYSLLPPHPNTFLGKKLAELNKEHGGEEEAAARMADVKDFWADVEENKIKPILAGLSPEVRAAVLERVHADEEILEGEAGAEKEAKTESKDQPKKADGPEDKPAAAGRSAEASEATSDGARKAGQSSVPPGSVKPKNRELDAVDFALRDIKAAYINAKRAYRISPERLQQLQAVLDKYLGTRNFHNYTIQKTYSDPSAKRHIKSFVANPKPIIIGNTEWLSLKVHGQSFMMHQIRKMVGLATLVVRCGTTLDRVEESYTNVKIAIPKAPGLGLLLERPVFENWNRKATEELGKDPIDFDRYSEELEAFKHKEIYSRIFDVEEKENSFHTFYQQLDQFKSTHFLWLSAGGVAVTELGQSSDSKTQEEVNRQLGDEDEDPEGGEG